MEAVTTVFGDTMHGHVIMSDDFQIPKLSDNPTPEERAEFVILRLEQFIRDNRTLDKGMSFKIWQSMAKTEIANALAEAETSQQKDDVITKRLLFTTAAAMVTIGFWGTAVSLNRFDYLAGGIICLIAGVFLFLSGYLFRNILMQFNFLCMQFAQQAQYMGGQNLPNLNLNEIVVTQFFGVMDFIWLLVVPMLTMRLFAEEVMPHFK